MELAEVEYEHESNQFTVDALRGRFISALNSECAEIVEELRAEPFKKFCASGIPFALRDIQDEFLLLQFWEHLRNDLIVCAFETFKHTSVARVDGTTVVSTRVRRHFLHPFCERWAVKLAENYYRKNPEHRTLYVSDIAKYYPPCPWVHQFWTALTGWTRKYRLNDSDHDNRWLLECAIYTMGYWAEHPGKAANLGLMESSLFHDNWLETIEPPDGLPKWYPNEQRRTTYLAKTKKIIRTSLSKSELLRNNSLRLRGATGSIAREAEMYCNQVEGHFRSNGWKKVRVNSGFEKHLQWTLRFQIKNQSFSSIAREWNINPWSVKREVEKVLKTLGIRRRPDVKPGRKKGQKDSVAARIQRDLGK